MIKKIIKKLDKLKSDKSNLQIKQSELQKQIDDVDFKIREFTNMKKDYEKLEKKYNDVTNPKIFCIIAIIIFLLFISLFGYAKYKKSKNLTDNSEQELIEINIINEVKTNETTTSNVIDNTKVKEKQEEQKKTNETPKEETKKEETKEEKSKQETTKKENTQNTTSKENKNTSQKPSNKDFLFTDGYTMENVTQAAQDYLKSYSYGGECIPIKDNEGVYLGMRVIFY